MQKKMQKMRCWSSNLPQGQGCCPGRPLAPSRVRRRWGQMVPGMLLSDSGGKTESGNLMPGDQGGC